VSGEGKWRKRKRKGISELCGFARRFLMYMRSMGLILILSDLMGKSDEWDGGDIGDG